MSKKRLKRLHFFCENLKYLLDKFSINQGHLGAYIDREQTTISNWTKGNSVPNVDDLVKIYRYFGFGMDALILMDLQNSSLLTDKYIENFKKLHKLPGEEASPNIVQDPELPFGEPVLDQLRKIDKKLDSLRELTMKVVEKEKMQEKKG